MVDLAIVIVSYNVCDLLRRCLQSVHASQRTITIAVCVVDNASQDGSAEMVRNEFPDVHLIANEENIGYPAANNQGLCLLGVTAVEHARRPRYCLLLNPDTEVPPEAFVEMIAFLDANRDVGVAGPRLVMPNGELDLACRRSFPTPDVSFYRMVGLSRLFPNSPRFGRYNMTFLDECETAEVDSVVGAFMMVRTEAVESIGLLDERFWMYGEDLDWAKRIKDAGWKVMYYPDVTVLHVKRASSRNSKRAQHEFYRAMLIFYYKHYYLDTPRLLHWLIVLAIALKGGRPIFGYVAEGPALLQSS
jgi:N-acetylglucosaminyl-diphospho-decaprenol L-rhamnosyltransferase